jgi:hypothetical protein
MNLDWLEFWVCLTLRPTVSRPVSWNETPIWGLRPDLYYRKIFAGLLLWSALSDERTGLSFTIAPGPRQRSNFWVQLQWDRDHVLLSQIPDLNSESELCYGRRSVGQSILEWSTRLGLTTGFLLLSDSCGFVDVGRSLWREDGSVVYNRCRSSQEQSFSGPSPLGLVPIFYCLRFGTSLFVVSYDSQGYGGGIRPLLHTGLTWIHESTPFL